LDFHPAQGQLSGVLMPLVIPESKKEKNVMALMAYRENMIEF
jgi:hypothetical protein